MESKKIPVSVTKTPYIQPPAGDLTLVPEEESCPYGCVDAALVDGRTVVGTVYDRERTFAVRVAEKGCAVCLRIVHYKDFNLGIFNYDSKVLLTHSLLNMWYVTFYVYFLYL